MFLGRSPHFKMTLTDISKGVGIHKSKVYSILNTLKGFSLVERDEYTKTYSLGLGLLSLSRKVLDNMDLREIVAPALELLAEATGTTALFGLVRDDDVFVVAKNEGIRDIRVTIRLGHRFPLTAGAHGKAIVAFLPETRRRDILQRERLFFHGKAARLDRQRLHAELARCREVGFACDVGELNSGVNAVAAPVVAGPENVIGVVLVIGTFPEEQVEAYGRRVAERARELSDVLGGGAFTNAHEEVTLVEL
jgi:DNA-binding IclR family transcriptional regulator